MKKLLIAFFIFLPGCTYYRITDLESGHQFYTTQYGVRTGANGAIGFRDEATGDWVVLQSHRNTIVSEEEFAAQTLKP